MTDRSWVRICCFYRRNKSLVIKKPGGLPIMAILPVALCRFFVRRSLRCLPLDKSLKKTYSRITKMDKR